VDRVMDTHTFGIQPDQIHYHGYSKDITER